jgi:hypothetical protein
MGIQDMDYYRDLERRNDRAVLAAELLRESFETKFAKRGAPSQNALDRLKLIAVLVAIAAAGYGYLSAQQPHRTDTASLSKRT